MQDRDTTSLETAQSLKSDRAPERETTTGTPDETTSAALREQRARALELAVAVARAADAKKAEDILILDVSGALGIADYFVIATARSRRQLAVVAESCDLAARRTGNRARAVEGGESGWVVADFVDVVLHVFEPNMRGFYDLEHLWADAPRVPWTPEPSPAAPAPPEPHGALEE